MTILVTGASGYLGSHLANRLCTDHKVIAIIRSESNLSRLRDHTNVTLHTLNSIEDVDALFDAYNIDTVLHTATNYGRNGESKEDIWHTNVTYALRTLESAIAHDVTTFLNADTVLDPRISHYAASKEEFLQQSASRVQTSALQFINVRLEQFYGPHVDHTNFIGYLAKVFLKPEVDIDLTGGIQKRDFIYIEDVVTAYKHILKNLNKFDKRDTVDVSTGIATPIRDVVVDMKRLCKAETKLNFGALEYRPHEMMESTSDPSRMAGLGWRPKTPLHQGLEQTIRAAKDDTS